MATQISLLSIQELVINGHIAPNNRARVQTELTNALQYCPTLLPSLQSYIDNTGNESLLIALSGTVPMQYGGNTYNIPVNMFIPCEYPDKPPIVFVRPAHGMVLQLDNPNVTRNGDCTHSYFRYWDPKFNNLSGSIKTLIDDFSKVPPLRSPSSVQPPRPSQPTQPQYSHSAHYSSPAMTPTSIGSIGRSASPTGSKNGPYPYQPSQVASPPKTMTPREQLAIKVRNRLARDSAPAIDLQKKLYETEIELTRELAYLADMEKTLPRLSAELDQVKTACDNDSLAIEAELKEFATLSENGGNTALAASVVPVDGFSGQALEESAKRDALEDVMYELMRRMNSENFESVMKIIRNSACDQFTCVALLEKMQKASSGVHGRSPSSIGRL